MDRAAGAVPNGGASGSHACSGAPLALAGGHGKVCK